MSLHGKDFTAVRRISDRADKTLAMPGETCERVPAGVLQALYKSGKIVANVRDDKPKKFTRGTATEVE